MPKRRKTAQKPLKKNETLKTKSACPASVKRTRSSQTSEPPRQRQSSRRTKAMKVVDEVVVDPAGLQSEKSAQSEVPSTCNAVVVYKQLFHQTQTYFAGEPSTQPTDSYSALHALALTPTSLEEFEFSRAELARANNRKLYSNVAKDLTKYCALLDYHIKKFQNAIDKLALVSLVKENMVKDNHVIELLEKREALKKVKIHLTRYIGLFDEASSSANHIVAELPTLPDAGPGSAASKKLTKLIFEKQMHKKKIAEIQSCLLALRDVCNTEFFNEKSLTDFNFRKHEAELVVTQSNLYNLFKSICKLNFRGGA